MMRGFLAALVLTGVTAAPAPVAQQVRDAGTPLPPGTGVIAGTVGVDGDASKPVRGAVVTLNHVDKAWADTTVTDERGQFTFQQVPAGRYLLSASKEGLVTIRYGATQPGRAGIAMVLGDGERREGLRMTLVRGAVLAGRVRLVNGDPAQGAQIHIQRVITGSSGRRYVDSFEHSATADDLGAYRLFGLAEGDYIIQAVPQLHFMSAGAAVLPTRSVDVQWARTQLRAERSSGEAPPPDRPTVSVVPVYYPGVLSRSSAEVVALGRGDVRDGLDFSLQLVPSYRVTGTVAWPSGELKASPRVFMIESRPDGGMDLMSGLYSADGANFAMAGVTPGDYLLIAAVPEQKLFALSDVRVASQDVQVALTLQPGLSLTGRVLFAGTLKPPDPKRFSLYLVPTGGGVMLEPSPAVLQPDGSFRIDGVVPGRYRLATGGSQAPWSLRSAIVADQDLAVTTVDVTAAFGAEPITVTFSDRATELSGVLQDALGRAASDYFIIVFSTNERAWFARSRAIAQTRPASDGQFSLRGLPPGDYYLAAVTDVERDEWFDAGFLRDLVPSSLRLSLPEGRRVVQNIQISR